MAFNVITATANFTRPADTTAYASDDIVANSVTAGSVVPLAFAAALSLQGAVLIRRARLFKSNTTITNAKFTLHFYGADPSLSSGISSGDNAAWTGHTPGASYIGSISFDLTGSAGRVFSDGAMAIAAVDIGPEIAEKLAAGRTVYGLLAAAAAYGPANAEVFTATLELVQN